MSRSFRGITSSWIDRPSCSAGAIRGIAGDPASRCSSVMRRSWSRRISRAVRSARIGTKVLTGLSHSSRTALIRHAIENAGRDPSANLIIVGELAPDLGDDRFRGRRRLREGRHKLHIRTPMRAHPGGCTFTRCWPGQSMPCDVLSGSLRRRFNTNLTRWHSNGMDKPDVVSPALSMWRPRAPRVALSPQRRPARRYW